MISICHAFNKSINCLEMRDGTACCLKAGCFFKLKQTSNNERSVSKEINLTISVDKRSLFRDNTVSFAVDVKCWLHLM